MSAIPTLDFRYQNVKNFINSLYGEDGEHISYVFIGRPQPWEDENRPPVPVNNLEDFFSCYQQMMSLKRIQGNDVFPMIRRFVWQSGLVYDMYRHDYSITNPAYSQATSLDNALYYVINQNNDVYVCLDNFLNAASTVEPSTQGYDPFFTSDGYQWMKLFSIKQQVLFDFSTRNYLPVTTDGVNLDNYQRTPGEITSVVIDNRGDGYTISPGGTTNEVASYYCNIVGDGYGAVASVRVTPPAVDNPEIGQGVGAVRIVRGGQNYTYANLDFTAGRVYSSLADLDEERNGLDPRGDGTFRSTVIINPPNGWGFDVGRQLGAYTAGVFSKLENTLSDFFPETTFRQIGILQDPTPSDLIPEKPNTMSGVYGFKVVEIEGQPEFIIGEMIYQDYFNQEKQRTETAKGMIVGWDEGNKIIRYVQIPELHVDDNGVLYQFQSGAFIHGQTSKKVVEPTSFNGSEAGLVFVDGFADTEVERYTGNLLYLTNLAPILRQKTQTERISLLIQF